MEASLLQAPNGAVFYKADSQAEELGLRDSWKKSFCENTVSPEGHVNSQSWLLLGGDGC